MRVSELINELQHFNPNAEVSVKVNGNALPPSLNWTCVREGSTPAETQQVYLGEFGVNEECCR